MRQREASLVIYDHRVETKATPLSAEGKLIQFRERELVSWGEISRENKDDGEMNNQT